MKKGKVKASRKAPAKKIVPPKRRAQAPKKEFRLEVGEIYASRNGDGVAKIIKRVPISKWPMEGKWLEPPNGDPECERSFALDGTWSVYLDGVPHDFDLVAPQRGEG